MPRLALIAVCLLLQLSASAAPPLDPATALQNARAHIAAQRYAEAAVLLDDAIGAVNNFSDERVKREALSALHFYAAVAASGKLDDDRAAMHVEKVLDLNPNMRITDTGKYSPAFVRLFNGVAAKRSPAAAAPAGAQKTFADLYPGYDAFRAPTLNGDASTWQGLPTLELLGSKDEKREWASLLSPDDRRAFIDRFWQRRDQTPGTEANEFRAEFERRFAFAAKVFPSPNGSGSVSDRGRVFALLGIPVFVERRPLRRDDGVEIVERFTMIAGSMERWVYKREQLQLATTKHNVQFRFVTQTGIGDGILQREDPIAMQALLTASANSLKPAGR